MSAPLSKKQQKAQSFRAKQKAKRDAVPDLPEADLEEDAEPAVAESSKAAAGKAAKSASAKKPAQGDDEDDDEAYAPLPEKKEKDDGGKKRKRTDADDAAVEGYGKAEKHRRVTEPKPKKDVTQRFILFLGNIGFKTTREQVADHFKESLGRIPSVRLLTEKGTGKSRGIAFLELASSTELQTALKLHHSVLGGKRLNVELTAGGGGKSEGRKEKLKARNERVSTQREKREKEAREKEAAAAKREGRAPPEPAGIAAEFSTEGQKIGHGKAAGDAGWGAPIGDGYKMRNGRRVKISSGGGKGGQGGDRRPQRPKWTPTGANAMAIS